MLMNNLDPEVAERPGRPRRLRRHRPGGALVGRVRRHRARRCATLADDETLLVQSGKPVGVFRTHEWAPRVLIANSNLVPEWANWDEFRRLEALGLTMYGQMTAGSWIYIGTPGDPPGHLRVLRRDRPPPLRRLAGRHDHADRRPRRHGWRPAARGHDERRRRAVHRGRPASASAGGSRPATSTRWPTTSTTRSTAAAAPSASARRAQRRPRAATPPRSLPALLERGFDADIVTDQTSAHDPLSATSRPTSRWRRPTSCARADPDEYVRRARALDAPRTARRWSASWTRGAEVFDYGNSLRAEAAARRLRARLRLPRLPARLHPAAVLRGQGPVPLGGAVGRPGRHRRHRPGRARGVPRRRRRCARWIRLAGERVAFQGLPARICWLGYGERHRLGLRFNEMVRSGELQRADRDRPRPPRLGLGGVAVPRDRGDGRRLRRDRRLAAAQRARQHRLAGRRG